MLQQRVPVRDANTLIRTPISRKAHVTHLFLNLFIMTWSVGHVECFGERIMYPYITRAINVWENQSNIEYNARTVFNVSLLC